MYCQAEGDKISLRLELDMKGQTIWLSKKGFATEAGVSNWWESEIPRLRVLIEDLDDRLSRMGNWGSARTNLLDRKIELRSELEHALLAERIHASKVRNTTTRGVARTANTELENEQKEGPQSWQEVEIAFLSDERVEICIGGKHRKTYNYGELGFEDRRNGKQNLAWLMLRELAKNQGIMARPSPGQNRAAIHKRVQEIRIRLKLRYRIDADPIPFNGTTYSASFRISCRPSFET